MQQQLSDNKTRSRAPEYLADLIDYTTSTLVKFGLKKDEAEKIAHEVSKQMCDEWGGQLIYFPQWIRMEITERDREIYKAFEGDNQQELAKKFKMSVQTIYKIIKKVRAEEIASRQTTLDL